MKITFDAKPILKWAGGKHALADQLIRYFPTDFSRYYELFLGGGSVLLTPQPEKVIVGDQNDWLLDTSPLNGDCGNDIGLIASGGPDRSEPPVSLRQSLNYG